jgi:hypothetical protein
MKMNQGKNKKVEQVAKHKVTQRCRQASILPEETRKRNVDRHTRRINCSSEISTRRSPLPMITVRNRIRNILGGETGKITFRRIR